MTRLGFQPDLELEGVLSSATKKLSVQLKEQWLRHLQDHKVLAANLIVLKDWLESTAFKHEELFLQTNSEFQNSEKPKISIFASITDDSTKPRNSKCSFKDGQHDICSCEKLKSMKLNERRKHVQKFRLCFNCLRPGHRSKDCKSITCSVPNCGRRHNKLLSLRLLKEGGYNRCLRWYDSTSNNDHTRKTPCDAKKNC